MLMLCAKLKSVLRPRVDRIRPAQRAAAAVVFGSVDDHQRSTSSRNTNSTKWQTFQDDLTTVFARSELPSGLDTLLLRAITASTDLRSLVEMPPHESIPDLVAVLTIMPVVRHDHFPWEQTKTKTKTTTTQSTRVDPSQVPPCRLTRWDKLIATEPMANTPDGEKRVAAAWQELLREQLLTYKESVAAIRSGLVDEVYEDIATLSGVPAADSQRSFPADKMVDFFILSRVAKELSESGSIRMMVEPLHPNRPDIGLRVMIKFTKSESEYPVVAELRSSDLDQGLVRVLSACEVEVGQRLGNQVKTETLPPTSHEVLGVASTAHKWLFLRNQDEKILLDDDDQENQLQYEEDGRPQRASLQKIMGKLHSFLSRERPAAE